jgi:hypothetical protein
MILQSLERVPLHGRWSCLDPTCSLHPLVPLQLVHLNEEMVGHRLLFVLALLKGQFIRLNKVLCLKGRECNENL